MCFFPCLTECFPPSDGVGRGATGGRDLASNSQIITSMLVPTTTRCGCKVCATIQYTCPKNQRQN
ncbi:hypothetical protein GLYMA_12G188150v4 [Glycine max]|nr:hypothetical protein GLYMA_12G188150v4 [Glycine max]KAH1143881.1 hypothetical protein GYH30_034214 [Glycine max]